MKLSEEPSEKHSTLSHSDTAAGIGTVGVPCGGLMQGRASGAGVGQVHGAGQLWGQSRGVGRRMPVVGRDTGGGQGGRSMHEDRGRVRRGSIDADGDHEGRLNARRGCQRGGQVVREGQSPVAPASGAEI